MRPKLQIALLACIALFFSADAWAGHLHPAVEVKLRGLAAGEKLAVIVELTEQAKLSEVVAASAGVSRKARGRAVVEALREVAGRRQGPIRAWLAQSQETRNAERIIPFWIFNGFAITATESVIRDLATRPDVLEVRLDRQIPPPTPVAGSAIAATSPSEWNIDLIRAPEVWAINPAYNGAGAVVGSFDTGVDFTHPDLNPHYRGNHHISWFDPYGEHPFPFDPNGHGTHTTGTAVGGDAGGTNIGVAPGATWIAAKGWSDSGIALSSVFHQIFEWFLAPGGDPENAPDVVINSWTFDETGCQTEFVADVEAWRAAGIFPAFASGNSGPDPGSVLSPGAYLQSFTVGATDVLDEVSWFSSQGPSPCSNAFKPNIAAPGDSILSAVPGGYDILSGTSMATPHVAGAVAVLRSINPAMTVEDLEFALTAGAKDIGDTGPDYGSGAGRLDLFTSAQIAILGPEMPVVKITASNAQAKEAGTVPGSFILSRTGSTENDLTVKYSIAGTASAGSDYLALGGSAVIPAGSTYVTVQVFPIDDAIVELDEDVILTISPDPAYIVSGSNCAAVTIVSDELIPDLSVSGLTAPTTAGAGQGITISETAKNAGAGAAEPSLTRFYLSSNSLLDAADVPIGSRNVPALSAGSTNTGTTTAVIPDGTATGTWYIIAKADAEQALVETSETNNTASRSIQIGPDLSMASLSAPTAAGAGQSIAVSETTRNQGGGAALESVTRFFLSRDSTLDALDIQIGSRAIPALAAATSSSGTTSVTLPQDTVAGTWYILAKADADATVTETNEINNTTSRSIRVGTDLVIMSLSASAVAGAGQSITVSETTVNQGGGTSAASVTRIFLSTNSTLNSTDLALGSRAVPPLASGSGSSGTTTVTIPQNVATGTWYLVIKADADETVAETSESNNTSARSIQVGPDLVTSDLSVPQSAGAGQSISVSETVTNRGGGASDASVTMLYLSTNSMLDASDLFLGSRAVSALGAGASSSATTTVTVPNSTATGTWYVIAKADADGRVTETTETNNTSAHSIQIGPDLVISSFTAPSTAGAGQNITISDATKNQGGGVAEASLTEFVLSKNNVVDISDTVLGSRSVPQIMPGATNTAATNVTIPAGLAAGTWYIIARADADDTVVETSETNNSSPRSIQIGADLVISALSAPSAAGAGQSISVSETTRNQGGGAGGASVTTIYFSASSTLDASDLPVGRRNIPTLVAGAGSSGTTTVTIPDGTAAGTWYLIAKADAEEAVTETSENNNTSARSIRIGPDLVISALSMPTTSSAGQTISVSATAKNQGGGTGEASVTVIYLSSNSTLDDSDIPVGSLSVPVLAAGTTSSGSTPVTIPAGTTAGTWYIIAKADGNRAVPETSETNNTYARSILISNGPDSPPAP